MQQNVNDLTQELQEKDNRLNQVLGELEKVCEERDTLAQQLKNEVQMLTPSKSTHSIAMNPFLAFFSLYFYAIYLYQYLIDI